jgi:hypothetical protein
MAKDDDMYELVCKEKFEHIIKQQEEVLGLLRGQNGTPGIVEEVRGLKRVYKAVVGAVASILILVGGIAANWIHHKLTN